MKSKECSTCFIKQQITKISPVVHGSFYDGTAAKGQAAVRPREMVVKLSVSGDKKDGKRQTHNSL